MSADKSPAFQFYPDDFMGSGKVAVMTAHEIGIYVLLLCYDWNEGGVEYNAEDLARFCRVTEAEFVTAWEKRIKRCFVERDGRFWNPRLERERDKQAKFRAKQVAAGLASAAARSNQRSTTVEPTFNSPIPSPAPATTGWRKRGKYDEPAPYKPDPFCKHCGGGMGKKHESDTRLTIIHREDCPDA